jgi:hypothetical protein
VYKKRAWQAATVHGKKARGERAAYGDGVKTSGITALGLVLAVAASLGGGGCRRQIGDDCQTSVDCDPNGTRACDLSQPGGYCTIIGCDEKSCPESSVCVRYFPEKYLVDSCNPACEDIAPCHPADCTPPDGGADGGAGCDSDAGVVCPQECVTGVEDRCSADELCLDVGLCARRALETRGCAKSCSSDGDCRDGYECRPVSSGMYSPGAGTLGSMVLTRNPVASTGFCAPHVTAAAP